MSDIFREVDEALKQEKAELWWRENGKTVIISCFLAIVVTALTSFGLRWMENVKIEKTTSFVHAVRENTVESLSAFSKDAPKDLAVLARLQAAGLAFDQGNYEKGQDILSEIINAGHGDDLYVDYAILVSVVQAMDQPKANPSDLLERLMPLTIKDNPWRFSALELKALLLFQQGEKEQSLTVIENILSDKQAPQSLMLRASKIKQVIQHSQPDQL